MPIAAPIGYNTITEFHLVPHLRKLLKGFGGNNTFNISSSGSSSQIPTFQITLSAAVVADQAIGIDSSGLGCPASSTIRAIGISTMTGAIGDIVQVQDSLSYVFSSAILTAGSDVWLLNGVTGTTSNITCTAPTATSGYRYQKIGFAETTSKMIIKIETSYIFN